MAYVGQGIKNGTFTVLDTSGNTYNGSNTTFNLGTQVGSPAQLLVSHDGVIQKPVTDYTIATGGTQITFTTAPASGASIFITEISGAVGGPMNRDINGDELILDADADTSITADTDDQIDVRIAGADDFQFTANTFTAASGSSIVTPTITLNTTGTTALSSLAASQWRVTANFTGDAAPIASNWEVSDSTGYGSLGSAMTESSGIFTFPSTGIYLVLFQGTMTSNSSENECGFRLQVTTDNSSYDAEGEAVASGSPGGSNETGSAQTAAIVDVTNTTNVKVRFAVYQADDSNTTIGSSTRHLTGATFIRLGDT